MAPLEEIPPEQEPGFALHSAGHSLGFCLLTFPISTFSAALLIGLRDSLLRTSPSVAPLWILLGVCALFFAWAGKSADWFRQSELYMAHGAGEGVYVFVLATFVLALLIGAQPRPEAGHLVTTGLFALGSWLCLLLVRRSRRHLEAAGLPQEEIQDQMASTWRSGAFMMIIIGAGGLACVILAFDVLAPADRPWSLGTALGYTLAGILLFWRNRRKRASRTEATTP